MKSTGIVRKVDELGRIVLPIEIRKMMDINVKDAAGIYPADRRRSSLGTYPAAHRSFSSNPGAIQQPGIPPGGRSQIWLPG